MKQSTSCVIGILIAIAGNATPRSALLAQTQAASLGRLTVQPHTMTLGTRTDLAGMRTVDSLPNTLVYVPQRCVGTRRCPLVVFLHDELTNAKAVVDAQSPFAEKHGMILLVPDQITPSSRNVDVAMQHALQEFAIDPDKIALAGESVGGVGTLLFGRQNFDVFSRLAPLSPSYARPFPYLTPPPLMDYPHDTSRGPQNPKTQFFVSVGIGELPEDMQTAMATVRREREDGHLVQLVLDLRLHQTREQDVDHMWGWLEESWAPRNTKQAASAATISVPLLTSKVFTKMATFWTSVMAGADSIGIARRQAYPKETIISVGPEQMSVFDVDMPALAAKDASIAAKLKTAGLTPQQEEAYRMALISARATKALKSPVDATSVLGKNVAFIQEYRAGADALEDLLGVPRCENSALAVLGC